MFDFGFNAERRCCLGLSLVFALTTILSTVAFERATAMPVETQVAADPIEGDASEAIDESSTQILPADRDLIHRILQCPINIVEGDAFATIVTVHGQVVDFDGAPVAGATVVLRESSSRRVSMEPDKYRYAKDRHRLRTPDVYARTITDRDGRFRFDQVKSPAYPPQGAAWGASEASLLAVHPAIGVGYFELPPTRETSMDRKEIVVRLRPVNTISGRLVTDQGTPLSGATVRLERLTQPSRNQSQTDGNWELWMSQLAPTVQTGADGVFRLEGLPQGLAATITADHPNAVTTGVVIATSNDVPLGEKESYGGRLRGQTILPSPAEVVADPGVKISGRVIDPQGQPIAEAQLNHHLTDERVHTDSRGEFTMRLSTPFISKLRKDGKTTVSIHVKRDGYLLHEESVALDTLEAKTPVAITLRPGVRVQGRVVDEDGNPVAGMLVQAIGHTTSELTGADGLYEMYLPAEPHVLAVGTFDRAYELPGIIELTRARTESEYGLWPHQVVDLSNGVAQQLPPIKVARRKPMTVVASLPDGSPAVGAGMVIKDEQPVNSQVAGQGEMAPFILTRSDQVTANAEGRAELLLQQNVTENAVVEIRLARERGAFAGSSAVKGIVEGKLQVMLQPALLIQGRVFVDEDAAKGAEVELTEVTPFGEGQSPVFPTMVKQNRLLAVTDQDGWYRFAVQPGVKCHTRVRRFGDDLIHNSGRVRLIEITGDRTRAPDIVLRRGLLRIAGVVQDASGQPIPDVSVRVSQEQVETSHWIGHEQNSQFETDSAGRFRLSNVPEGTFDLWVRSGGGKGQPNNITTVKAQAGDEDITVVLSTGKVKAIPRLAPIRID